MIIPLQSVKIFLSVIVEKEASILHARQVSGNGNTVVIKLTRGRDKTVVRDWTAGSGISLSNMQTSKEGPGSLSGGGDPVLNDEMGLVR